MVAVSHADRLKDDGRQDKNGERQLVGVSSKMAKSDHECARKCLIGARLLRTVRNASDHFDFEQTSTVFFDQSQTLAIRKMVRLQDSNNSINMLYLNSLSKT
jgi:hypothetical protein